MGCGFTTGCGVLALKITYNFFSKKDFQLLQEEILQFHLKSASLSADNLKIRVPVCLILHLHAATVSTHVLSLCDTHLHHLVCSGLGMWPEHLSCAEASLRASGTWWIRAGHQVDQLFRVHEVHNAIPPCAVMVVVVPTTGCIRHYLNRCSCKPTMCILAIEKQKSTEGVSNTYLLDLAHFIATCYQHPRSLQSHRAPRTIP